MAVATGLLVSDDAAALFGAALALALALVWLLPERRWLRGWLLPASIGFGVVVALSLPTFVAWNLVPSLRHLSGRWPVVEIKQAPGAKADPMEVKGGVVMHELLHQTSTPRGNQVTRRVVVPLVAEGWTKQQAVTVWLACSPNQSGAEATERACKELFSGSRVGRPSTASLAEVIADAERRHGLRSSPDVLMLTLEPHPTFNAWGDVGFAAFLVILGAGFALFLSGRRQQKVS
jgi:hypothetical protein